MKRLYWLSLTLIVLLMACAGPAAVEPAVAPDAVEETAVSTTVDNDTVAYTDEEAGFSIALPAGWTTVDASIEAFAQMRSEAGQNGALSSLTDDYVQALLDSGLQLYALSEATTALNSDLPVSIKIIRRAAPVTMSLDEYVTDTATQLEDILELTSALEQAPMLLGNDEAIQLRYSMQMPTAVDTKTEVHNTQYYLIHGSDLYIITLEMGQDLVDDYLAAGETAVETFTISGG